ncbi:oxidoreductase, partial [Rothia kristinae]
MSTETARAAAEPGAPDPRASDPRTATGRTLGWGIVSTGAIARKVTPEIALLADARLVGVSSRSEEPARAFAEEFGVARAYGGPDGMGRMLADPEVQVVYIATPHGQHHEHIRAALEAGKHVVCEKALTITAAQARDVVELADQRGLFLMEGLWTRFLPIRARI